MDEVFKHLNNIYAMDQATLGVLCVLCAVSAFALKDYLAFPIMAIFAFPILFVCSVLAQYTFILGELYVPRRMDQWLMWTIMAAICGNIVGITLVAGLGHLRGAATRSGSRPTRRSLR